ncbi:hypothetical protein C8J57DRAFT_1512113 [Mycena rebaudengoi]|nr:hypothetical protein C8J57DRAFT_1512113 [Mycena rebaudengoi]
MPIVASTQGFSITDSYRKTRTVKRPQVALTGGYTFTDYKAQGQTLGYVLIDLEPPPRGKLTPFSAYVALSRSRSRDQVRILRGFDPLLFTTHPSLELEAEDVRLTLLERDTREWWESSRGPAEDRLRPSRVAPVASGTKAAT